MFSFFRGAGKRLSAPFSSNPIERFVKSRNHHDGIASEHESENSTTIRGSFAARYLSQFFEVVNSCTNEQKKEYLQSSENRRVLFDFINGLLLFFNEGDCNFYLYEYIDGLFNLLAMDEHAVTSYYHSLGFQSLCLKDILDALHSDGMSKTPLVRKIVFKAINTYPELESTLFISQNIRRLFNSVYWNDTSSKLKHAARQLLILSKTKRYLIKELTNETILENLDIRFAQRDFRRGSYTRKQGVFYASVLVTFLEDPKQLPNYILARSGGNLNIIKSISDIEQVLRSRGGFESIKSSGIEELHFSLSPQERLERLMISLQPAVQKTNQWALSSKLYGLSADVKQAYGLYQYLQDEENQQNYITLLEEGCSPDFMQRIMMHDVCYPPLIPSILMAENSGQALFHEEVQQLTL